MWKSLRKKKDKFKWYTKQNTEEKWLCVKMTHKMGSDRCEKNVPYKPNDCSLSVFQINRKKMKASTEEQIILEV